jgi:hypothetical protein
MNKTEVVQKLLELTGKQSLDEAVDVVENVLTVAAKQNYILSNMGVLTIVYGPTGMGLFTLSPDATTSLEKLAMVEKAILDFQASLIQQRQRLMSVAKEQPKE